MPLTRLQRLNLMLVLLVVQATQVLLLAVAVFAFFTLFGVVAIRPEIVESWLGHAPDRRVAQHPADPGLDLPGRVLRALLHRLRHHRRDLPQQFFTEITTELEHAVGVRAVYRALR